jgi:hypothetical protein
VAFESLLPGKWQELPNTKIRSVLPNPLPERPSVNVSTNPAGILDAWNGGTVDTKRSRMLLVANGGHDSWAGNEVYAITASPAGVARIRDHSPLTGSSSSQPALADGSPTSRHTYGGVCYLPDLDRVMFTGGATCPFGSIDKTIWHALLATARPEYEHNSAAQPVRETFGYCLQYDPVSRFGILFDRDWVHRVNVRTRALAGTIRTMSVELSTDASALIDPLRRRLVLLDSTGPRCRTVGLDPPHAEAAFAMSNVPAAVGSNRSPGWGMDPTVDRYVYWGGGNSVYTVHPDTGAWSQVATNTGPNVPQQPLGTFGRWGYLPAFNVWLLVNDIDQNAWVFKVSELAAAWETLPNGALQFTEQRQGPTVGLRLLTALRGQAWDFNGRQYPTEADARAAVEAYATEQRVRKVKR